MNDATVQTMISVGIDIGTTTTQLVISRLTLENTASAALIPRVEITGKEVIHRSQIYFTPLLNHHLVNAVAVSQIVENEYRRAGVTSRDIDTGAVIITGETAKKENAKAILEALADFAGDFVVATAGPNLESVYAGKGSGAAAFSSERHQIIINVDVGGGTSNYAVFQEGEAIDTACLNVGGHLIEIEPGTSRVSYIAEPAQAVMKTLNRAITIGEEISLSLLREVSTAMARCVVEVLHSKVPSEVTRQLLMTPSLTLNYPVAKVMISGGVADHVYSDQPPSSVAEVSRFGDFGPLLGWTLREALLETGFELIKPLETVRATVIGTGTQSVNLSGSTIHVEEQTLPLRNVLVALPFTNCQRGLPETADQIAGLVRKAVNALTTEGDNHLIALAMQGPKTLTFQDIQILAHGIIAGMEDYLTRTHTLIVIIEKDCGKILGQSISALYAKPLDLICIDQLSVGSSDYIDIGKPLMGGRVVPVVIKTLVFETKK
ncbi:ethanolamine ammonia-lyase reactivating factor EutA [Sporomusa malonica]|uniref:Reactivating factor of Adenosylcobalamin-dependent ethanolamine ammonia lyase n=1 Tax=Sporomusa malonica TaxID=112901 RepID=A0A1W1YIS7_9FIRM|nr:ethanolamine ammonia-lyase reactivating factor EutA [Sporomusa malonica]SMC36016.1 Reactivating factor of Adenosylcobalamin-dependent ethanolamine ammonia lyase [Sporomusa malonica]